MARTNPARGPIPVPAPTRISGLVREGSAAAALLGELEYEVRASVTLTFGGGTNEIQRELVAQFGLGMPRSR